MIRYSLAWATVMALLVVTAGCGTDPLKDKTKDLKDKADKLVKDAENKAKDAGDKMASDAAEKAKKSIIESIEKQFPQFDDKIKELKGDAHKDASGLLAKLKEALKDLSAAGPDKWNAAKTTVETLLGDLRKKLGLDK